VIEVNGPHTALPDRLFATSHGKNPPDPISPWRAFFHVERYRRKCPPTPGNAHRNGPISACTPSPSPAACGGCEGVYYWQSCGPPGGQESARYFVGFSNAACRAGIGGSRRYGPGLDGGSTDPGTIRAYSTHSIPLTREGHSAPAPLFYDLRPIPFRTVCQTSRSWCLTISVRRSVFLPMPSRLQGPALALYQRGILSSGKACALAGVKRWEWELLPGARKIPRHYADEDLEQDNRL